MGKRLHFARLCTDQSGELFSFTLGEEPRPTWYQHWSLLKNSVNFSLNHFYIDCLKPIAGHYKNLWIWCVFFHRREYYHYFYHHYYYRVWLYFIEMSAVTDRGVCFGCGGASWRVCRSARNTQCVVLTGDSVCLLWPCKHMQIAEQRAE